MRKSYSILGSTGSIGLTSLKIFEKDKNFTPYLFSANQNYNLICKQIKKFKPKYFIIFDNKTFLKVKSKFKNSRRTIILNKLEKINLKKNQITITAIPGLAGLNPTMIMTKFSKKILLANKESIVCGWNLIFDIAKKNKTKLISIDSEIFSIEKLIKNYDLNFIKNIYITASGGPFLNYKLNLFKEIKPTQAIKHPNWKMGKKISIDSATLMNKMFEIIEVRKLLNIHKNKIKIIVHPESLIHGLVELKNGIIKLIYHETSMAIPIFNSIFEKNKNIENFYNIKKTLFKTNLSFKSVDPARFPIIKIKNRLEEHPSTGIIINGANEVLVSQFLKENLPFSSIAKTIFKILNNRNYKKYAVKKPNRLDKIFLIDRWARETTMKILKKRFND